MILAPLSGLRCARRLRGEFGGHRECGSSVRWRIIRAVFIALLSLPVVAAPAQGVEISKSNAQDIAGLIQYAAESGSQVDRALHDRFWSLIPDSARRDPSAFFRKFDLIAEIAFQKELWESIRLSVEAKNVVKTTSYESAKERAFAHNPKRQEMSARADRMLTAAATGEPYRGQRGETVLTEEYAGRVLEDLNGSYAQLELLLNPVWQGR